jgi:hypothetical protein
MLQRIDDVDDIAEAESSFCQNGRRWLSGVGSSRLASPRRWAERHFGKVARSRQRLLCAGGSGAFAPAQGCCRSAPATTAFDALIGISFRLLYCATGAAAVNNRISTVY